MLVEVLLEFLIGIVNVELFKPIHLETQTDVLSSDLCLVHRYFEISSNF